MNRKRVKISQSLKVKDVDSPTFMWFQQAWGNNPASEPMLQEKAREFVQGLGNDWFKVSNEWLL